MSCYKLIKNKEYGYRLSLFRKMILLVIHTHMQVLQHEKDEMFQDALQNIMYKIDYFFKAHQISRIDLKVIQCFDKAKVLQQIFNGVEFHFVAFVIELIDRFLNYGLNDTVIVFDRQTVSRYKLYKIKLNTYEKALSKDKYKQWKQSEKEAKKIAKKVWEKHKELLQIKLSRKEDA